MSSDTYGMVLLVIISVYIAGSVLWFKLVVPYFHERKKNDRRSEKLAAKIEQDKKYDEEYERQKQKTEQYASLYRMGTTSIDLASEPDRTMVQLRNYTESLSSVEAGSGEVDVAAAVSDMAEELRDHIDNEVLASLDEGNPVGTPQISDDVASLQDRLSAVEGSVRRSMSLGDMTFHGTRTGRYSSSSHPHFDLKPATTKKKEPLDFSKLSRRIRVKKE